MNERRAKGLYWDRAWKLVEGCTKVSSGCDNCWSESETAMRARHPNHKISSRARQVLSDEGPFDGFGAEILCRHDNLDLPLRTKKPTVFSIWNDLYHEDVPLAFVCDAVRTMDRARRLGHTFLVLTKRAERMADFLSEVDEEIPDHVWHGVTAENQQTADERIPHLLRVPGKRFVSVEPILGPVDLDSIPWADGPTDGPPSVHAVLLGGESGHGARPMHPDWARLVRDQCAAAGVPFFYKQGWGQRPVKVPPLDGLQHTALPWS